MQFYFWIFPLSSLYIMLAKRTHGEINHKCNDTDISVWIVRPLARFCSRWIVWLVHAKFSFGRVGTHLVRFRFGWMVGLLIAKFHFGWVRLLLARYHFGWTLRPPRSRCGRCRMLRHTHVQAQEDHDSDEQEYHNQYEPVLQCSHHHWRHEARGTVKLLISFTELKKYFTLMNLAYTLKTLLQLLFHRFKYN